MKALRPFVETARTGATTLAAARLNRSHGAICRQIKILEESFGVQLFNREKGRLVLTEAGEHYFDVVSKALSALERASLDLKRMREDGSIRIACPTVFAKRWLLPRLERYVERHPTIDLHLIDSPEGVAPRSTDYDVAILTSLNEERHVEADPLMPELIFPVKSPRKVRKGVEEDKPAFIHTTDAIASWSRWSGQTTFKSSHEKHLRIEDLDVAISAAELGKGVLVARGQLIMNQLTSGTLGLCGDVAKQIDTAYWLVQPRVTTRGPLVRSFSSFVRSEALLAFDELKKQVSCTVERFV